MSIAVSALVQPSKTLFRLCAAVCCGCAVLGLAFMFGAVAAITKAMALVVALLCLICAALGMRSLWRARQAWQLDISGTGQIRLRRDSSGVDSPGDGMLVRLLADSTMWPNFLLLRLRDEHGRVHRVAILPDSLAPDAFRAVSVACRWIAGHRFSE